MTSCNERNLVGKQEKYMLTKEIHKTTSEAEKMRHVLSSIAQELQRFHLKSILSQNNPNESQDIYGKLGVLRKSLKKKQHMINKLKSNIKTACFIAKTFVATQDIETLNSHLKSAKSEALLLSTESKFRDSQLQKLSLEVKVLEDKILCLRTFIEKGYRQLQKIRNEPLEEISVSMQLKKIIICCGQYYADFTNEHAKCVQLEQKNSYLSNKISVLENNLAAVKEELDSLRWYKTRSQKVKQLSTLQPKSNVKLTDSDDNNTLNLDLYRNDLDMTNSNHEESIKRELSVSCKTDLTTHFALVKKLMIDQNSMLNDLRNLSDELQL